MELYKKILVVHLIILLFCVSAEAGADKLINRAGDSGTPASKWQKAFKDGMGSKRSFWIAWSVDRMMGENTWFLGSDRFCGCITTCNFDSTFVNMKGEALGKIVYGSSYKVKTPVRKSNREQIREAAEEAIANIDGKRKGRKIKRVSKEVAVLFLFEPEKGRYPVRIVHSNMSMPFNSGGNRIYWLGKTDEKISFTFMKNLFLKEKNEKVAKRYISALGYHSNSSDVIQFMSSVLRGNYSDNIRKRTAGELGDQNSPVAAEALLKTAMQDFSLDVRRAAVNGLEDIELPVAVNALIKIADSANNIYIRLKAINVLGDVGTPEAARALKRIAWEDKTLRIQCKAVDAFEDLDNNRGVPYLAEIAKSHPVSKVRKRALDTLSDIDDPRAFETIRSIVKQ